MLAAASPPDRHGYFSLGVNADYVASFIGRARFFLEANAADAAHVRAQPDPRQPGARLGRRRPPAGRGRPPAPYRDVDEQIAAHVAERIPDRATLQTGIGAIPNAILSALGDHRDLGVHTELISDGVMELVEAGVVTGVAQAAQPHQDRRHVRARH